MDVLHLPDERQRNAVEQLHDHLLLRHHQRPQLLHQLRQRHGESAQHAEADRRVAEEEAVDVDDALVVRQRQSALARQQ